MITRAVALSAQGARFDQMPILLRPASGKDAPRKLRADIPFHDGKAAVIARFEREYLTDLLGRSGDNLSQAARIAGLERKHLYKVLERAGLLRSRAKDTDD